MRRWTWRIRLWGRSIFGGRGVVGSGVFLLTWIGFGNTDAVIGMSRRVLLFYWKLEDWLPRPIHPRILIRRLLRMFVWEVGFTWLFGM